MKAKAVVFTKPDTVEFQEVFCPDPGADNVVIRTTHSWISNGTEGSYLRGERIGGDIPSHPGGPVPFPIVPGYQKVGVIEQVGEQEYAGEDQYSDAGEILEKALELLPEIQRSVVMLRDYEGYSYDEIASITDLSASQVKVYIYRARIRLKNYIVKMENVI